MSHVLVEMSYKVHRGSIAGRAVEPRAVVEDFDPDPLEDRCLRLGARGKRLPMDQAAFEAAPEDFHHGFVVVVAPSAQAGDDSGLGELLPVVALATFCIGDNRAPDEPASGVGATALVVDRTPGWR